MTEIHAEQGTQIIDWPERDQNQTQQQQRPQQQQQRTGGQQTARQQQGQGQQRQQAAPQADFDSFDDDIPF
ncbi:single-stranded DNA-binding protein [compost metagenome]